METAALLLYAIGLAVATPTSNQPGQQNNLFREDYISFGHVQEKTFHLQNQEVNWYQAYEICRSNGKMLATISNEQENSRLTALLNGYSSPPQSVWLSATDLGSEGSFKWMSTGEPLTFTAWAKGQPDNVNGNEDCVHMYKYDDGYAWNDMYCTNTYKFVCESY